MTQSDNQSVQMDFDRDAVLAAFLAEAEEGLASMEQALIALERGSAEPEVLHDIFRVAHTIKGNAAALELAPLVTFAHEVEDLLESLRRQDIAVTEDVISLLLAAVDELRVLVPSAAAGATSLTERQNRLRSDIEALAGGARGVAVPSSTQAIISQSASPSGAVSTIAARGT